MKRCTRCGSPDVFNYCPAGEGGEPCRFVDDEKPSWAKTTPALERPREWWKSFAHRHPFTAEMLYLVGSLAVSAGAKSARRVLPRRFRW